MGTEAFQPSYTIRSFCEAEKISEPTYFNLRSQGLGPREMRFPGIHAVRITHAARLAWQEMMQNPTGEQAEAVRAVTEKMRAMSRHAASRSVESPKHVSKGTTPRRRRQRAEA
jgi:hypothetical protein